MDRRDGVRVTSAGVLMIGWCGVSSTCDVLGIANLTSRDDDDNDDEDEDEPFDLPVIGFGWVIWDFEIAFVDFAAIGVFDSALVGFSTSM